MKEIKDEELLKKYKERLFYASMIVSSFVIAAYGFIWGFESFLYPFLYFNKVPLDAKIYSSFIFTLAALLPLKLLPYYFTIASFLTQFLLPVSVSFLFQKEIRPLVFSTLFIVFVHYYLTAPIYPSLDLAAFSLMFLPLAFRRSYSFLFFIPSIFFFQSEKILLLFFLFLIFYFFIKESPSFLTLAIPLVLSSKIAPILLLILSFLLLLNLAVSYLKGASFMPSIALILIGAFLAYPLILPKRELAPLGVMSLKLLEKYEKYAKAKEPILSGTKDNTIFLFLNLFSEVCYPTYYDLDWKDKLSSLDKIHLARLYKESKDFYSDFMAEKLPYGRILLFENTQLELIKRLKGEFFVFRKVEVFNKEIKGKFLELKGNLLTSLFGKWRISRLYTPERTYILSSNPDLPDLYYFEKAKILVLLGPKARENQYFRLMIRNLNADEPFSIKYGVY